MHGRPHVAAVRRLFCLACVVVLMTRLMFPPTLTVMSCGRVRPWLLRYPLLLSSVARLAMFNLNSDSLKLLAVAYSGTMT